MTIRSETSTLSLSEGRLSKVFTGLALLLTVGGCAAPMPHQSEALSTEVDISGAAVLSVVPPTELSVRRDFVKSNTNMPYLGFICLPCVGAAVGSNTATEKKTQSEEDAMVLPALQESLDPRFSRGLWESGLRSTVGRARDIAISNVEVIDRSDSPTDIQNRKGENEALLFVELDHYLSQDLNKFRMQAHVRLFDQKGKRLLDTYYFYLPTMIAGDTKENAVANWSANGAEAYRRTAEVGVRSILDAIDFTLLSYRSNKDAVLEDAKDLLDRRSCYAGDFEVGIPLPAYESGQILIAREDYWVVRLANKDILIIPSCNR